MNKYTKNISNESEIDHKEMIKKLRQKRLITNSIMAFFSGLVIALIIMLGDVTNYESIAEFFSSDRIVDMFIISIIMFITLETMMLYSYFTRGDNNVNAKLMPVLCVTSIVTYGMCVMFSALINIYVAPLLLCGLLISTLIDKRAGIMASVLISQAFFVTFVLISHEVDVVAGAASLVAAITATILIVINFDRAKTRLRFVILSAIVGLLTGLLTVLINSISNDISLVSALFSGMWTFAACIISLALYFIVLPILEYVFKIDTNYRLAEICSFEFRLMKKLAKEAPGTFNHSLVVGNLSELCASAIGEDAMLARACAYYHDIGKIKNPESFVENQSGYNPHDDLIPEVSIKIITNHTDDGYNLLKAERMPDIIADVAREHHGTTAVSYFLFKAQNLTEDALNKWNFSYKDPKPSTKIAAIIMIVDTVEAASRAMAADMTDVDGYRAFIRKLIKDKQDQYQFSNCDITFKDLQKIEETLVEAVPNMYHARIKYNK
ncbi:MAG: HDIG domain-containing protein [Bacillota bacterium]